MNSEAFEKISLNRKEKRGKRIIETWSTVPEFLIE